MMRWRRRRMYVDDLPTTHDARFLALFLVIVVVIFGALYAVGFVVAGDKVPAGTTVAGERIGGLTRAQAGVAVRQHLDAVLTRPVKAVAAGRSVTVVPARAGVSLDVDATIDAAMDGADWDPAHMLKVLEGGGHVDPVFVVDRQRLAVALAPLAAMVETRPVSSTVSVVAGRAVVRAGRDGRRLDLAGAPALLVAALRDGRPVVALRLQSEPPLVDASAASAFVDKTLRPALSAPVVVSVAGRPVTVPPGLFGPALRVSVEGGVLRLQIAPGDLLTRTSALLRAQPGRPVDARIVIRGDAPVVVPSRPGRTVDKASWAQAVLAAATSSGSRRASARSTVVAPGFTTADARALHITSLVGGAAAPAAPRLSVALRVAARSMNATVVLPGADFSFVRSVGQLGASTLRSPLETATRTAAVRAGMAITRAPPSAGFGGDLGFRNGSTYPVYVRSMVVTRASGPLQVVVQLWGTHL